MDRLYLTADPSTQYNQQGLVPMKKLSLLALLAVTSCASIIEGRSQQITINTNPPEADCKLERQGTPLGHVNPTPGSILIEKTKYDLLITCSKAGYQDSTFMNKSGSAGATFGNIVAGGFIGWGIDSASGADNKYESPVNLTLNPIIPTQTVQDEVPAPHHKKKK
jgi:hypothetical protein